MSLGIKSSWRARIGWHGVPGLSLVPRELAIRPLHATPFAVHYRQLSSEARGVTPAVADTVQGSDYGASKTSAVEYQLKRYVGEIEPAAPVRQHQSSRQSVLVEPFIEYPHKAEAHRSKHRHHKSVTRQLQLERIRMAQRKPLPNWRFVLQNLTAWTPEQMSSDWQVDALKVVLPKEAAKEMLSGVDNNIWAINRRTGCVMKLYQGVGPDGSTSLVLSGSETSLNKATEEILQVAKKAIVIRLPNRSVDAVSDAQSQTGLAAHKTKKPSKERAIISTPWREPQLEGVHRPYIIKTSVKDIAKPTEWTKESFEHYVASLTNARVAPHLVSRVYSSDTDHDKTVVSLLHDAFNDEAAQPCLSLSAFKRALTFMSQKGLSHRPDARALFVRMETYGLGMDAEVFNILLQSTVKVQDLRSFDSMLRLMAGRGHMPNLDTWLLFLRLVQNEDVKKYVVGAMTSKGLLRTRAAVQRVAEEMAPYDIGRAISQGKDLQAFLLEQETRYGPGWLTRHAGNRIVEILGRFSRFEESFALLDIMSCDHPMSHPDIVTFNTILTHAKIQNKISVAATVLRKMEEVAPRVVPDSVTYHLLFEMAWKHRHPSVVRVVWYYAALAQLTSYQMRRRISLLLKGAASGAGGEKLGQLQGSALVAGSTAGPHGLVPAGADAPKTGSQLNRWLKEQYAAWEPEVSLGAMFAEALERDLQARRDVKKGGDATRLPEPKPLVLGLRKKEVSDGSSDGTDKEGLLLRKAVQI
ncbi:Reticulocyte-binding protein 2 a [Pleurostoma richardsiae]|uniref:Reticulocyte-binding protein 2 a n=1 Tax=Pleurostoma richardsiae TaxID=41990 RepID=A0AA38S0R1_9PEZI|nr:Reticulocyte-binding protein 2 a [Pleurostoma richardsiae]